MKVPRRFAITGMAALLLAACASTSEPPPEPPVTLTPVAGSDLQQVELTEQAVSRVGIETSPVELAPVAVDGAEPSPHLVIPYAAVVYDSEGATWAYVSPAARTYVREPVDVVTIQGDTAVLASGPRVGTPVVVVGAPELLGAEAEISGEE
jgi:hypothetical protein